MSINMRILFLFSAFFIQNLILGQVLPFVELTEDKNKVVLDIRYATSYNFTGTRLYDCGRCFLHPTVAKALQRAAEDFKKQGYKIILFDCYRPLSISLLVVAVPLSRSGTGLAHKL